MKLRCVLGVALGLWAMQMSAQEPAALKTPKDKTSYGMGVALARSFKSQGIDVDPELLVKGLKDVLSGEKLLMSDDDLRTTMTAFEEEVRQKQAQARSVAAENNKKAGDAFLAENARKDGVVVLPSGLQYKILKAGEGKKPTDTDTVMCQYRGTLIDGTEFDSSYRSGQPATFEVKGVIPGFREALKLMPVGSKWQLVIPSEMAYGQRGAGNAIEPNATLIFEIELISIKDQP
jgi:FKBP-type peptidyl-prolyl cis-trans isomerase